MSELFLACALLSGSIGAPHPLAAPGITSLTNRSVKYVIPKKHFVELKRSAVTAIVVDNEAIDVVQLPKHRAGYNGVASLTHKSRSENLFVPSIAGLNYEHIHDGTLAVDKERFEPRRSPMQLRVIDDFTVEVYQPPTPNWKLESCGRYRLLSDGTIEYTFECIPRAKTFQQGYIGLFWASYIHNPQDRAINFVGRSADDESKSSDWIKALSPRHGVDSTHPPAGPLPDLNVNPKFSLTLVNHPSKVVYTKPWYFGVSHEMAYALIFRSRDRIWFAQSPTGGGAANPAWDFQWFIPDYKVDEAYGFVMRAVYVPFQDRRQLEAAVGNHLKMLNE